MYNPRFKGPIEGWAVNYAAGQFWRLRASMEWEDVMQEAYVVFARCANKYPVIDTPQHFMGLFKRAWTNHIHDLAVQDGRLRACEPLVTDRDGDEEVPEPVGDLEHDGELAILLRQAPAEVTSLLNLMLRAPQELVETALASWTLDKRRKDKGSGKLNKLLGLPPNTDVMEMARKHFQ